ncbi:MAG TPA: bifunctional riboflavin kinase/FAD synthetase [Spirochaetota bacterium]|nr:bifunctional riboflavin kinase/FAD synthetase [Spirochaetota bacterium]HQO38840.1 bifunctional riboflavin kinase/FAD synthetase [Spirochaetota bacterium]
MSCESIRLYHEIPENDGSIINPVVTIGNFDGVHTGHRKIIETLLLKSREHSGEPFVITFRNHPRTVIHPGSVCRMITTVEEKQQALAELGVRNIVMLEFTREVADLTAEEFYHELLIGRLGAREIVIGYDHAFGKNREGNIDYLKNLAKRTGILITQVPVEAIEGSAVSSTLLRRELDSGNMERVEKLLGRKYSISGRVIKGDGRGRQLGYPTANVKPSSPDKIIPAVGVYAVSVNIRGKEYGGMLNIGFNPTFNGTAMSIEVNIFGFNEDIYGEELSLIFHGKIRDERKFESADALVKQIESDRAEAAKILHA